MALWERVAEPKVGLFTKSEPQLFWQGGESIALYRLPILHPNSGKKTKLSGM